ncbi:MAG: hypothetical protein JXR25_05450 [Pontiellaceae bacterium]|nr:hypothetical protein [Pontiellaceae bacterium]MBN2784251.1 hypothetical protein [Pontiellaceae bacterium]
MVDECPQCGNRGITSARKYEKERKRNLALMMEGFAEEADNPQNCAHALHTLMIYNMKSWFHDVQKSYGIRFNADMRIQFLIAQGLSRFGNYNEAITFCRKAIVLGYGKQAEELMEYCQTLSEASAGIADLEALKVQPEPVFKAYLPLGAVVLTTVASFITMGINSLKNYKAWIVNGTLQNYRFSVDDKVYEIEPGATRQITLKLGEHELKTDSMPPKQFTYSIPLLKQLVKKNVMVINPDDMALLAIDDTEDENPNEDTIYSHSGQVRIFPGLSTRLHGLRKISAQNRRNDPIGLYRPETHIAMVELMNQFGLPAAAEKYAQKALNLDPDTPEAKELLRVALGDSSDEEITAFLKPALETAPTRLPWHLYYQDYMRIHHPGHNLEREYTIRCKEHSNEPASYYLLACVVEDRENAYRFFEHADRNNGMNGLGNFSIARDLFNRGQFADALPFARKALQIDKKNRKFHNLNENILLAMRDYDTLLAMAMEEKSDAPDQETAERLILYLTCAGYHREAAAEIAKLGELRQVELPRLNAIRYYSVGNVSDYLECLADNGSSHIAMEKSLHMDKIQQADELASKDEKKPYWEHLIIYCAAMACKDSDIAQRNIETAMQKIGTDNSTQHHITQMLSGREVPNEETIRDLDIPASEKAILCVALGYRVPERQVQLNKLALVYNFTPAYPQLLVRKWIREADEAHATANRSVSREIARGL